MKGAGLLAYSWCRSNRKPFSFMTTIYQPRGKDRHTDAGVRAAAGIPVRLNAADPLFFGNSLAMELESAPRTHRFQATRSGG